MGLISIIFIILISRFVITYCTQIFVFYGLMIYRNVNELSNLEFYLFLQFLFPQSIFYYHSIKT